MRRVAAVTMAFAAAMGACKGGSHAAPVTTTVPTTTTSTTTVEQLHAAELAADLPLVKKFWRDLSDAWADPKGGNAIFDYEAQHAYPPLELTASECMKNSGAGASRPDATKDYIEYVLDESSVERDDGWVMRFGKLEGQVPQGRIYIMKVALTEYLNGVTQTPSTDEVHITIMNGVAYDFPQCAA